MTDGNNLFPIFIKLDKLKLLLVGGGNVGLEKLNALLSNDSNANIKVVADQIKSEVVDIADIYPNVELAFRKFFPEDLNDKDLVFLATDNHKLHRRIKSMAKNQNIIVNVADTPEMCDFYLGSIVKKGDLKIGISTNGKSPTVAKRLKEFLNDILPENIHETLGNMKKIRNHLKGDFEYKVQYLNGITKNWLNNRE
ncbi:MAG TPA: bifunctional precorrin-2 dehydrogenase/sirohydrochlorin ferrochelatase [Cyclobacteriaceae bacterium]